MLTPKARLAAWASPEAVTSRRLAKALPIRKPLARSHRSTRASCAGVGPYTALNCSWVTTRR